MQFNSSKNVRFYIKLCTFDKTFKVMEVQIWTCNEAEHTVQ